MAAPLSKSTLRIAWRNLGRNKKRTALAVAAIAVGQLAFLATAGLVTGYVDQFFADVTGPMVGHAQIHRPGWRDDRSVDLTLADVDGTLEGLRGDPNVANASARVFSPALAALTEEGFMGLVVGIDPGAESHEAGLLAGQAPEGSLANGGVLVGHSFARRYDIQKGMELAIIGQDVDGSIANDLFTVSGIIATPVEAINTLGIVMSLDDAQELLAMWDQAHEIVIHVKDRELLSDTVTRLSSLPSLVDMEVLPWQELVPHVVNMVGFIDVWKLIILVIVFIAAAAGIANTMLMSTFERTHEFGMLLSLGCGPGRISRMAALEAILLGLIGVAVGTALGLGFVLLTAESGIDYAALSGRSTYEVGFKGLQLSSHVYPRVSLRDVLTGVVAVFLTAMLSVAWPVLHIVRLEPMEAMRS
jgi:ABC-type lipoprotein release transport system permease subunit